jgi:hypothetical protein
MVASPVTVSSGNSVSFSYHHLYTLLDFHIIGSSGSTISAIRLTGTDLAYSGGTVDISQTTPSGAYTVNNITGTSANVTVTLTSPLSLSNSPQSVYMMITPGHSGESIYFDLNIDGTWRRINKTAPTGGFARGTKYNVAVNADNANIIFDDPIFKAYFVSHFDTGSDGEISPAEAAAVTDDINVQDGSIT